MSNKISKNAENIHNNVDKILKFGDRRRTAITFDPAEGLTKQSMTAECDINTIMRKYTDTGTIDPRIVRQGGRYGDFSEVTDYHAAVSLVLNAQESFASLPAHLRDRFQNDPAKFLEFATNPASREEMEKLGLLEPSKSKGEVDTSSSPEAIPGANSAPGSASNSPASKP